MKNKIHDWLIKVLISGKDNALKAGNINKTTFAINFGMFGVDRIFLTPKQELIIAILIKYYGYKCYEITPTFDIYF